MVKYLPRDFPDISTFFFFFSSNFGVDDDDDSQARDFPRDSSDIGTFVFCQTLMMIMIHDQWFCQKIQQTLTHLFFVRL